MIEVSSVVKSPINLAIIFSGGGTTAEAVIKATGSGGVLEGLVNVQVGIATREGVGGIDKLKRLGIPTIIRDSRRYRRRNEGGRLALDVEAYGYALMESIQFFEEFQEVSLDGLAQLGSIPQTSGEVIGYFSKNGKFIINQHPGALDPTHLDSQGRRLDFGGRGMMGSAVTAAALDFYWRTGQNPFTESTVHTVAAEVDGGRILSAVPFRHVEFRSRTALGYRKNYEDKLMRVTNDFQSALIKVEHDNVINTLGAIARGENPIFKRNGHLINEEYEDELHRSRELAKKLYPYG